MSAPVLSRLFNARGKADRKKGRSKAVAEVAAEGPPPRRVAVPRQPPQVKPRTPVPNPQSQSFSRGYGSALPTSLIYIALSTRGCAPWRPDAVMSTTGGENKTRPPNFQGPSRAHADGAKGAPLSRPVHPIAGQADSRVDQKALTRKDNSRRDSSRRLRLRLCRHSVSTSRCGNLNPLPFR